MGRTPEPRKETLVKLVVMLDHGTKERIRNAANSPKFKGNMSQMALEAILAYLDRADHGMA